MRRKHRVREKWNYHPFAEVPMRKAPALRGGVLDHVIHLKEKCRDRDRPVNQIQTPSERQNNEHQWIKLGEGVSGRSLRRQESQTLKPAYCSSEAPTGKHREMRSRGIPTQARASILRAIGND